jgi:hypothetical protein
MSVGGRIAAHVNRRDTMRMLLAVCALATFLTAAVWAQTTPATATATPLTDSDIQLMRSDVQADKNEIILATMQFTDTESTTFWPVYRDYSRDQHLIADERIQLIKDYAKDYDTMDDAKAQGMFQRMIKIDDKTLKLREDYWPKFMKALGAKRAAKFYQVDNRINLIINLQLTSAIPLIP